MNSNKMYSPFFPSYVDVLVEELSSNGIKIKRTHAHELVATFFGFKSYAAFKSQRLDDQYKSPTSAIESDDALLERAQKLESNLGFPVTDDLINLIYSSLLGLYSYESSQIGGAFIRALRQMKDNLYPNTRVFEGSIFLDIDDLTVFGDIASSDDFEPSLLYPLDYPEIFYIVKGIEAFNSQLTKDHLELEMKPPIVLGDVLANIIEWYSPGKVETFIKFRAC